MSILATIGILDTVLSHISPSYRPAIVTEILPSWWTWQVWWIALLIVVLIATLHTAARKICELTPKIAIKLSFDEARPEYKQINRAGTEETYSIGLIAVGGKIENPEIFVSSLVKLTPRGRKKGIKIPRVPLTPAMSYPTAIVNPGMPPTYFVNVFKYKARRKEIEFCSNFSTKPMQLEHGEYRLVLRAKASNVSKGARIDLTLKFDKKNNLKVEEKEYE